MEQQVLVTGGCGFIGSNLIPILLKSGMKVRVLDNLSRGSKKYLRGLDCEIIVGDILDFEKTRKAASDMDIVIHLAAYGSVVESVANPVRNFEINVTGTLNLLQACVKNGTSRFIFASTGGALIGDAEPPVDEDSLPKPISPYGASKLCGEAYCHAFAKSKGLNTVALRFANAYGPNSAHKIGAITVFSKALLNDKAIMVFGDGSAARDFLYVKDICRGILLAINGSTNPGDVYHLASGVETSINELMDMMKQIAGKPEHPVKYLPSRPGEVGRNFARYNKAQTQLGFSPKISLKEGLGLTWNLV